MDHQADLRGEAAHQLEEAVGPATAPVVAVAEAATVDAVPEEEHTAQTEAEAEGVAVDATEDHPSTVAHRRNSTGRVQAETSRGYKQMGLAAAAVLEVEDGRTEQVQAGPGLEQERAKEVVHTG